MPKAAQIWGSVHPSLALSDEILTLLNGETVTLTEQDLVIADRTGPLSLAGILGGNATKVVSTSGDIIVEAGNFRPALGRRTPHQAGLRRMSALTGRGALSRHRVHPRSPGQPQHPHRRFERGCLSRPVADMPTLAQRVRALEEERNAQRATIDCFHARSLHGRDRKPYAGGNRAEKNSGWWLSSVEKWPSSG